MKAAIPMNPFQGLRILLLDGETVQAVCMAEELRSIDCHVTVLCCSRCSYGYYSKYPNKRILLPCKPNDYNEVFSFLYNLLRTNHYDVVLPMNDDGAIVLSKYKKQLSSLTHFHIPDWDVFIKGYNKGNLLSICLEKNIPHPRTRTIELNDKTIDDFPLPALIKPDCTCGARGMTLIHSVDELRELYPSIFKKYGTCHLQEFISPGGRQIEVQILLTHEKEVAYSSVISKQRIYPVNGGSSCCCNTIINDKIVEQCAKALHSLGWEGFADFDMIEDPKDGIVKIIELNPRVPACIKAADIAGIKYGPLLVCDALNKPLPVMKYTPGPRLRYLGFEVLWFIKSKKRWKTTPRWFNFFEKNLAYQDMSWKDPLSFFAGTLGKIKSLLSPNFRKEKKGI